MVAALLAVMVVGALPSTAGARRDDLPTEQRLPAQGATVADATAGLDVRFTCPAYHPYVYDDVVVGAGEGYHVILARAADVGPDGLVLATNRVETRDALALDGQPGICTAVPDAAEHGLLPPEPGTWFWQSYRDCATYLCTGGVEVSDVWPVTVTRTVCTAGRAALATARRDLTTARAALKARRTAARRARVSALGDRIATLQARLRLVDHCAR
jgi:hypothetical protein